MIPRSAAIKAVEENSAIPSSSTKYGVIYQATGERRYLPFCACSVLSLRCAGWNGAVRVLVDKIDFDTACFEELGVEVVPVEVPALGRLAARSIKTRLNEYSDFQHSLYLDCDIIALRNPALLWNEIDEAPLALAYDFNSVENALNGSKPERQYTRELVVSGQQFNSGVLAWTRGAVANRFFAVWHDEWLVYKGIDQLALMRALLKTTISPFVLPERFNFYRHDMILKALHEDVVFWHLWGGRDLRLFRSTFGKDFETYRKAFGVGSRELELAHHRRFRRKYAIHLLYQRLKRRIEPN